MLLKTEVLVAREVNYAEVGFEMVETAALGTDTEIPQDEDDPTTELERPTLRNVPPQQSIIVYGCPSELGSRDLSKAVSFR